MKKNHVTLTLVGLGLVLTACALKPICFAQKRFVAVAAGRVATKAKCKKPSVLEKKFNEALSSVTSCKTMQAVETGPIADLICPPLSAVVGTWAATKLPDEAQCDLAAGAVGIAEDFASFCKLIPVDAGEL